MLSGSFYPDESVERSFYMVHYPDCQAINNLTIVGVFDSQQLIEDALVGLNRAGFKPDVITILEKERTTTVQEPEFKFEDKRAAFPGFIPAAMVGGISGALIAGGVTLITGFWSLRTFALIEAGLAGAIIGLSLGALAVGFNKLGFLQNSPEETGADQSNNAYARLSISVPDEKTLDEVRAILERNGAYGTRFYKRPIPQSILRARY
jgi:hypothetical protein